MPKKLGPDGVPVEIPSTAPRRGTSIFGLDRPPRPVEEASPPPKPARRLFLDDEPPTRPMTGRKSFGPKDDESGTKPLSGAPAAGIPDSAEPRTVIAGGPRRPRRSEARPGNADQVHGQSGIADPVVGWLVVVDGPGKGLFVRLGNGQNSIGRGDGCRARLDFGDEEISRDNHAVVSYDPKGNAFYLHQGTGINLVYLNEKPVLQPTPLTQGDSINMGETTLRFVALCGDDFTWRDADEPKCQ